MVHKLVCILAYLGLNASLCPQILGAIPSLVASEGVASEEVRPRVVPVRSVWNVLSPEHKQDKLDRSRQYQTKLTQEMRQMARLQAEQKLGALVEDGAMTEGDMLVALEHVDNLLVHPLDILQASEEALRQIPFLSSYQIAQLIRYRTERRGRVTQIEELAFVPGWDEETVRLVLPLLTVGEGVQTSVEDWRRLFGGGRSSLALVSGFLSENPRPDYEGPASKMSLRWRYEGGRGHLSASLGAERDYYEPWSYGGRKGFDSYHGHVALTGVGWIRRLVLGDYRVSWGEGLAVSHGSRPTSLLSLSLGVGGGVRPAVGLSESAFGRGGAIELGHRRVRLSAFASWRRMDGRISEDGFVRGLSESGLHRSQRELSLRNGVDIRSLGGRISYETPRLSLSAQSVRSSFGRGRLSRPLGVNPSAHELMGRASYSNHSLSYRYESGDGRLMLSGEVALSGEAKGWALAQSVVYRGDRAGDLRLSLRRITPRYWAYLGRSYTHYRLPHDEEGVSILYEHRSLIPRTRLSLGADLYRPVSREAEPRGHKAGKLLRLECEHRLRADWTLRGRWAFHTKEGEGSRHNLSAESRWWQYGWGLALGLKASRAHTTWGWAPYLRGEMRLSERWRLAGSSGYYNVSEWAGRLYHYEPRLRYEYGGQVLYGRGWVFTALCSAKLGGRLSLQARYSGKFSRDDARRRHELAFALVYK